MLQHQLCAPSTSNALAQPRIVRIATNLYAVCLEVMKIIPAKHILESAWAAGHIDAETLILESSSGNFALGLAVVCRELGLQLHIVGDPAIDAALRRMLENLGTRVDIIDKPDRFGAYQRLRLERIAELQRQHPNSLWTRQYDNPGNPQAYQPLARLLIEAVGKRFDLVASVGSGGSSVGLACALRAQGASIELIGVDTFNSILFGLPDGVRTIRGLGNSVMPKVLDHTQFDCVHWLTGRQANCAARELHARHALFCGPTSGAAFQVARHAAMQHPERDVLFIAPDTGYRYQGTVFDPDWLRASGLYLEASLRSPTEVTDLRHVHAADEWTCLAWDRRSMREIQPAAQVSAS